MAISVKYFITDSGGNFIDWSQNVAGFSISGKETQAYGGGGVDTAYVQAGTSADLTVLGGGDDKIYLTGNLANYTQSIAQGTGVYTFTRTAGLPLGQSEVVKVTVSNENDVLYFADGRIVLNAETDTRLFDGTNFQPLQFGWLTAGGTPASGPSERGTPTTATTPTRVFITDAAGIDLPGLPQPGQRMVVSGSVGVDSVYVKAGTQVDASNLGGGNDKIYLVGNLTDYVQSIAQETGVYTLTRTTGSLVEVVKITLSNEDDVLYFADGNITLNAETDPRLFDGTTFNQLQTAWLTAGGTPGGATAVTNINISTAPSLSGQSVISGKALAGATVNVTIDPDNNTTTANSFAYTVMANTNGDYSLNLATATPTSGIASFVAGTASLSVAQTSASGTSPATVITLPVITTTTYSVSMASDQVNEGGIAVFTVTRSGDTSGVGTVDYTTQNGTATAGTDYTAAVSTTLTFAAGETTKTVTVATLGDAAVEGNETFNLVLRNPVGGYLGVAASATIVDSNVGLFSIAGTATGVSFSESVGTYTFTVNRAGLTSAAATVVVNSGCGTATAGSDYNSINQTLSFAAGETSKTLTVTITDDALIEGNETFNVQLVSASSGNLIDAANASVTATIQDSEAAIVSLDSAAAGLVFSEGVGTVTFSLTRSGLTTSAVSVLVQSSGGTATSGTDYTAVNQTITFAAGETSKTVTVTITNDATLEGNETFNLQLSNPSAGALIGSGAASITATILDNDQSIWSVSTDATVSEAAGFASYTVSRTGSTGAATISFATAGGTASAGADYTAFNQVLSFATGETSKTVIVALTNDSTAEGNETVVGAISNASSGSIATGTATATILDNDQSIWSVSTAATVSEAAGFVSYAVSRTGSTGAATISFATAGGTASAGADYTAFNQVLSFAAGETNKTVIVALTNDSTAEGNETVVGAIINASSGSIDTGTATATILDNDQSIWSVSTAATVSEAAGFVSYTISRTGSTGAATISFATAGGTATAGADYTAFNQVLSFATGETNKTVIVALTNDSTPEPDRSVVGAISNASSGSIATGTATATVLDDDQMVWSVASAGSVSEAAGFATFTVSRTGLSGPANIRFGTFGNNATPGIDFTAVESQLLTFAQGEMSKTITVAVTDDVVGEDIESFNGYISDASSGSISRGELFVNIVDNDLTAWSVSTAGASEAAGFMTFTVSRTGLTAAASIRFTTAGGTASAGADYAAFNGILNFAEGETVKTVTVAMVNDAVAEGNEAVVGIISNPTVGIVTTATATATLIDDDQSIWSVSTETTNVSEGAGFAVFTVSRAGAADAASIRFTASGGSAINANPSASAGIDYTAFNEVLNFAAGETTKTVRVGLIDNAVPGSTPLLQGVLSDASSGTIATGRAVLNILDNDQALWSIESSFYTNEDSSYALYYISRTGAMNAATIDFDSVGRASNPVADYIPPPKQTLSFAEGESFKVLKFIIVNDSVIETADERVVGFLSNPSSGTLGATVTGSGFGRFATYFGIHDEDTSYWSVSASSAAEDAGFISFTVSREGTTAPATITFGTAGGTATPGLQYAAGGPQLLTFAEGELSKTILVAVVNDALANGNVTVTGVIANASTGSVQVSAATATIQDDESPSAWSVSSGVIVGEAAGFATYTVSRSGALNAATISFATVGGLAMAGSDYTEVNRTLSFAVGENTKTVLVALTNDSALEGDETIIAAISNASSGSVATATATATLWDDDQSRWTMQTQLSGMTESPGFVVMTAHRTGTLGAATIDVATVGGSAMAGADYTALRQTLVFKEGEISKTVMVAVNDDTVAERQENVLLSLSNASTGVIALSIADQRILENDLSRTTFTVSAPVTSVSEEASMATFTIARNLNVDAAQTIEYFVSGGTAVAGTDYTAISPSSVSFAAGETLKLVAISLIGDSVQDGNKTLTLGLRNASGGAIVTSTATVNLLDNETVAAAGAPAYTVAATSDNVFESNATVGFSVTRGGNTSVASTSYFRTNGGSATAGADYTAITSRTLNWLAGETTKVVFVDLVDDASAESSETIIGQSATSSDFTTGALSATLTVLDDDSPASGTQAYTIAVPSGSVFESNGAVSFSITRSGDLTSASTSYFDTNGGTALAAADYEAIAAQTLSWAPGETIKNVFVTLVNDAAAEASETIIGRSATDSAFATGVTTVIANVLDDDVFNATPGVADVLTVGTVNGDYLGGSIINTGDGNDLVTYGGANHTATRIDLGAGNDTFTNAVPGVLVVNNAQFIGGSGVDTLSLSGTSAYNFSSTSSTGSLLTGFEIVDLRTATSIQTMNLSLQDVLEFSSGNAVANTLRIIGGANDRLNLQALGKTLNTLQPGTSNLTDVDGAAYNVTAHASGTNAALNDVTIGPVAGGVANSNVYDVYRFDHSGQSLTLLISSLMTTNII